MKKIYISLVILLLPVLCLAAQQSTDVDTAMYNVINSTHIVNGSILSEDIKDGTIANADLGANSVGGYNIIGSTIVTGDIKNETILSEDIYNGTIASADIADGTIANGDMAANSVGSYNIIDSTIASADILNETIASADILNGTIGNADMGQNSIGSYQIIDSTITTADILNGTIKGEDMESNTVGSTQLADGFTATSITSTYVTATKFYGNGSGLSGISAGGSSYESIGWNLPFQAYVGDGIAYYRFIDTFTISNDPSGHAITIAYDSPDSTTTWSGQTDFQISVDSTTTNTWVNITASPIRISTTTSVNHAHTSASNLRVTVLPTGTWLRLDCDAIGTNAGGDPIDVTIWGIKKENE